MLVAADAVLAWRMASEEATQASVEGAEDLEQLPQVAMMAFRSNIVVSSSAGVGSPSRSRSHSRRNHRGGSCLLPVRGRGLGGAGRPPFSGGSSSEGSPPPARGGGGVTRVSHGIRWYLFREGEGSPPP